LQTLQSYQAMASYGQDAVEPKSHIDAFFLYRYDRYHLCATK
jgi:hypothetical protein